MHDDPDTVSTGIITEHDITTATRSTWTLDTREEELEEKNDDRSFDRIFERQRTPPFVSVNMISSPYRTGCVSTEPFGLFEEESFRKSNRFDEVQQTDRRRINAERRVERIIVVPVAVTSAVPPLVVAVCSTPVAKQQTCSDFSPVNFASCVQLLTKTI